MAIIILKQLSNFLIKKYLRPCFLVGKSKIILPAYGVFTGGIDSRDKIFRKVFDSNYDAYSSLKKKFIKIAH